MMYDSVINIIKIITIFQIFLVSIFLLFHPQRKSKKNLLLVLFIGSKALFIGDALLIGFHKYLPLVALGFLCIGTTFQYLLGPAIYFVMVVTTNSSFSFKPKHFVHLVPFLAYLGLIISQYQIQPTEIKLILLQNWFPYTASWSRTVYLMNYIQFTLYGVAALRVLSRAREDMLYFNSQSIERNIIFLKFIIYDFIVVWGVNVVSVYFPFSRTGEMILWVTTVFNIFFIANAIVYQGMKFPDLFRDGPENLRKYEKNALSEQEKADYAKKINDLMKVQKPYLNPTLSLSDLAMQLAIPLYTLSQVLNVVFNQNFYDFINRLRVEESKLLLSGTSNNEKTILEVLYRCGFNSKSAFNAAFRKYTNMTPREFRKSANSGSLSKTLSAVSS